jgi:anti-sigma regulatory factor (Ser/Thr protein kinase)
VETLLTVDAARSFAGRPESARAARAWAVSHLPSGSPAADDVALMVSDLVTHALHYSRSGLPGGSVVVHLKIGSGRVRVDVTDEGADPGLTEPIWRVGAPVDTEGELGASLFLVHELADSFGAEGSRRWFTLSLGGAR